MEFCPTFDIIGDYFAEALNESQFRRFHKIIIGIHEDGIASSNASVGALLEEKKVKLDKEKEKVHEYYKLAYD